MCHRSLHPNPQYQCQALRLSQTGHTPAWWSSVCHVHSYYLTFSCLRWLLCPLRGKLPPWLSFIKEVNKEDRARPRCFRHVANWHGMWVWCGAPQKGKTSGAGWACDLGASPAAMQPSLALFSPCDHAVALCVFVGFAKSRSSHSF